jgi:hypothetical protein
MDDPAKTTEEKCQAPIFDFDIACPQCGYNLRGLVERRCPECGQGFDPATVLKPPKREPGPNLFRAIPGILFRPREFWASDSVRQSYGPNWGLVFLWMALHGGLAFALHDLCEACWLYDYRGDPIRGVLERDQTILGLACGVVMTASVLVHGLLCIPALAAAEVDDSEGAAKAVVGYSSIFAGTAVVFFQMVRFWLNHREPTLGVGNWVHVVGIAGALGLTCACVLWGRALFHGGKAVSKGSDACAWWCVATNVSWIIGLLLLYLVWK